LTKRIPGLNLANPVHLLAFGFGSGVIPKAPGTWGTLVAVPLYVLLQGVSMAVYLSLVLALLLLGIWLCDVAARDLGVHDHPGIVWDEIVGYLITMIAAPAGWPWWLAGFVLFRLFDILKPWPISAIDKGVAGGLGIMLDDILAGLMALACLQLCAWLLL
jgi:phosphatidylglycerophosphatase A